MPESLSNSAGPGRHSDPREAPLLDRADAAVAMATAAGAAQARAWTSAKRSVEYSLRDGILEKVQEDTSRSLSLDVYVDGRYSYHSTSDLREASMRAFIDEAVAMTRVLAPDPHRKLADPARYPADDSPALGLADARVESLDRDARMARLQAIADNIGSVEGLISWTAGLTTSSSASATVNTRGLRASQSGTSIWSGAELTLQDPGGARPEEWYWGGGRSLGDLPDPAVIARRCVALAQARLGSAKGPTARTLLVVDPRAAGRLAGYLLRSANARSIQQGRSFWADSIGQKRFSEKLSLWDDPLRQGGHSSRPYDGEGIAARKLALIEAGVVKNVYVDTYYGSKAGMAVTTGGRSNLQWAHGTRDLQAILADVPDAIYLTSWLGGNADGTTGDFSFGLRGHRITDGQIGGPIGEMNVTGNLVDLFAKLVEVGNDPWAYSSSYTPTLVFEDVQFSGA